MVVIGTFEWSTPYSRKIPKTDALVIILVSGITVITLNLALAVIRMESSSPPLVLPGNRPCIFKGIRIKEDGTKVYYLHGPLFFGSVTDLNLGISKNGNGNLWLSAYARNPGFGTIPVWVMIVLIIVFKAGKNIKLRHISSNCRALLKKA